MYTRPAYLWLAWLLQVIVKALIVNGYQKGAPATLDLWKGRYGASCAAALGIALTLFVIGFSMPCAREMHSDTFDLGAVGYFLFGAVPLFIDGVHRNQTLKTHAGVPEIISFLLLAGAMVFSWGLTTAGPCGVAGVSVGLVSLCFGLGFLLF
jgi:hypothetical protein